MGEGGTGGGPGTAPGGGLRLGPVPLSGPGAAGRAWAARPRRGLSRAGGAGASPHANPPRVSQFCSKPAQNPSHKRPLLSARVSAAP